eukprot:81905-Chlamydomonas_euryale.AAC.1
MPAPASSRNMRDATAPPPSSAESSQLVTFSYSQSGRRRGERERIRETGRQICKEDAARETNLQRERWGAAAYPVPQPVPAYPVPQP